jgi:hypothetical protein
MISSILGNNEKIYARKCIVKSVSYQDSSKFFDENHLQGFARSQSEAVGLYYDNELVCCASFGKPRFAKQFDWELLRFASKKLINVVGGLSRCLKGKTSIISYADRRYSVGNSYSKCGFSLIRTSSPNYFYFKQNKGIFSRQTYQKHKLKGLLETFDPNKTE